MEGNVKVKIGEVLVK